jgi:hypothetical protein
MRTLVLFSALAALVSTEPRAASQSVATPSSSEADTSGGSQEFAQASGALPEAPLPAHPASNGTSTTLPPCPPPAVQSGAGGGNAVQSSTPCSPAPNIYKRFLDTTTPVPLTPEQKAHLAFHNLKTWSNLATITGTAAYTISTDAHTAYGPGWKGFGRNTGYGLLQDTTGEFFGTFLIPSLAHQDPHYHRLPHANIPRRFLHAITETFRAQSDYGKPMPNYSALLTNPICAEISNLYVPGVNGNGPSTAARIMTGYATEPVDNLITEFLPDVASHIHVHDIFVQRILNKMATGQYIP